MQRRSAHDGFPALKPSCDCVTAATNARSAGSTDRHFLDSSDGFPGRTAGCDRLSAGGDADSKRDLAGARLARHGRICGSMVIDTIPGETLGLLGGASSISRPHTHPSNTVEG
jgi:hypothetical protein